MSVEVETVEVDINIAPSEQTDEQIKAVLESFEAENLEDEKTEKEEEGEDGKEAEVETEETEASTETEEAEHSEIEVLKKQMAEQQALYEENLSLMKDQSDRAFSAKDQESTRRVQLEEKLKEFEKQNAVSLDDITNEDFLDDPMDKIKKIMSGVKTDGTGLTQEQVDARVIEIYRAEQLADQDARIAQDNNKKEILKIVPNIEDLKEEMGEVLKAQGVEDSTIELFKKDVWKVDRSYLQPIAVAAMKDRELKELRAKYEGGADDVVSKIKNAQTKTKSINGKGTKSSPSEINLQDTDLHKLSEEDFKEKLKLFKT